MEVKDIIIPFRFVTPVLKLYCLGDIHSGTIHCVEDDIKAKVDEIKREYLKKKCIVRWLGMGDYGECITPTDRRWDPSQKAIAPWLKQDDIAESQRRWLVELFDPIKDICIGLLYGNHEEDIRRFHFTNIQQHICDDLKVDNLGYSSFVRFFFKREKSNETRMMTGVFTHGAGWAITKGAKLNKLRRFMDDFDAQIYGYAHMHDIIIDTKPYMTTTGRAFDHAKIKAIEAVGAVTGSWFRTYTQGIVASYGETRVYPPTVIGCVYFTLNPVTGEVDVHRSKNLRGG